MMIDEIFKKHTLFVPRPLDLAETYVCEMMVTAAPTALIRDLFQHGYSVVLVSVGDRDSKRGLILFICHGGAELVTPKGFLMPIAT